MSTQQHSDRLREYLWLLRRRKWGIIIVAALTLAATMAFTLQETKIYEGTTKVLVNATQDPNSNIGPQAPDLPTEQQVVGSSPVAAAALGSLHLSMSEPALLSGLNVTPVAGTTSVLSIAYDSSSPSLAAKAANAFAHAYVAFRDSGLANAYISALSQAQASATKLRSSIAVIDRKLGQASPSGQSAALQGQRDTLTARLGVLEQEIAQLQSSAVTNGNNAAQVIQTASVPSSPIRPQRVRNGILGLIGGILLGVLVALFRHRLDIRFKHPREFEEELQAPLVGSVPRVSGWRRPTDALVLLHSPKAPVSEMYRTLATNLSFTVHEHGTRLLLVTSALRGEGKSTVAANLAIATAQGGKRVLIVSADLRRPRLHRMFDLPNEGIADLVAGSKTLADVLQDPGVPDLRFIGSGDPPRDPAALLGSHRMSELIDEIRSVQCDLILFDCPPVLPVADASILAASADGALCVLDASHTTHAALHEARDQLSNAGARIMGGVYNNFDRSNTYPSEYYGLPYSESDARQEQAYATNGSQERRSLWNRSRSSDVHANGNSDVHTVSDVQSSTPDEPGH